MGIGIPLPSVWITDLGVDCFTRFGEINLVHSAVAMDPQAQLFTSYDKTIAYLHKDGHTRSMFTLEPAEVPVAA